MPNLHVLDVKKNVVAWESLLYYDVTIYNIYLFTNQGPTKGMGTFKAN
jgi:hypothetical protein